jgi:hypothetical protein
MITKIISGRQTGADQAALAVALKLDIPHGGWIPKDRLTEDGPLPDKYNLQEMPTSIYPEGSEKNILDSDGTLIISHGKLTGGSALTRELAVKYNKPNIHIDLNIIPEFEAALKVSNWIRDNNVGILNVAGPRASKDPHINQKAMDVLESVVYLMDIGSAPDKTIDSSEKVANPQTVDEAVEQLIFGLPLKDKTSIANMTEDELNVLNLTLGQYIRNNLRLWDENSELMKSCRKVSENILLDPDQASGVIIKELWKKLQRTYKLRVVK